MVDKKVEDMDESELKKELKKMYQELNDLSDKQMEDLDFEGKIKMKKRNEDGEIVEEREAPI